MVVVGLELHGNGTWLVCLVLLRATSSSVYSILSK